MDECKTLNAGRLPITRQELIDLCPDPQPRTGRHRKHAPEPLIRRAVTEEMGHVAFGTWADKENEELLSGGVLANVSNIAAT